MSDVFEGMPLGAIFEANGTLWVKKNSGASNLQVGGDSAIVHKDAFAGVPIQVVWEKK